MRWLLVFLCLVAPIRALAQRRGVAQFAPQKYDIFIVGGPSRQGDFPPGLNTQTEPYNLRSDETTDGYGFDLDIDGAIKKSVTAPSGKSRVARTVTITSTNYYWYYNRLWYFNQTNLFYYAKFYDDVVVPQRSSKIVFNEDNSNIKNICPYGQDSMVVGKTTGSYLLSNIADTRALIQKTDLGQEFAIYDTNSIIEINDSVFVSNSNGVYALTGGQVKELSRVLRDDLVGVSNETFTADYDNGRLITTGGMVYELETGKWFEYNGSSFRYTTRQFHLPDWAPFVVDRLLFVISHSNTSDGWLKYQIRRDDNQWSSEFRAQLPYQAEKYVLVSWTLQQATEARKVQVRITDISANILLFQIRMDVGIANVDDYTQ
jgi:hypothetical protein